MPAHVVGPTALGGQVGGRLGDICRFGARCPFAGELVNCIWACNIYLEKKFKKLKVFKINLNYILDTLEPFWVLRHAT
jgi:hypothetical protein